MQGYGVKYIKVPRSGKDDEGESTIVWRYFEVPEVGEVSSVQLKVRPWCQQGGDCAGYQGILPGLPSRQAPGEIRGLHGGTGMGSPLSCSGSMVYGT